MKDSERSHVHLTLARSAALFEDWMQAKLEFDDVLVAPEHQPINPEDQDEIIPDQQTTFGIAKSANQQKPKEPAWKDLALQELLENAPSKDELDKLSHVKTPRFNKVDASTTFSSPQHGGDGNQQRLPRSLLRS